MGVMNVAKPYHPIPRTFRITYAGTDYEGLEVLMSSTALREVREITRIKQDPDELDRLYQMLADNLLEWNVVDDDGNPVPANLDGLLEQDPAMVMRILGDWLENMIGVATPLRVPPTPGVRSAGLSLGMEVL